MAEVNLLKSIPYLLTAPSSRIWIDYDEEADVLYIAFPVCKRYIIDVEKLNQQRFSCATQA